MSDLFCRAAKKLMQILCKPPKIHTGLQGNPEKPTNDLVHISNSVLSPMVPAVFRPLTGSLNHAQYYLVAGLHTRWGCVLLVLLSSMEDPDCDSFSVYIPDCDQ